MKKAIFLHIYYPELCNEMILRLKMTFFEFNLYINLVKGSSEHLKDLLLEEFPNAKININENKGQDIGGQLRNIEYWLEYGEDEEFLIFLHTKKDDSLRNLLMSIIFPTKVSIIENYFNNEKIGMVGVKDWNLYYSTFTLNDTPDLSFNYEIAQSLRYSAPIHYCNEYCDRFKLNNFKNNVFGFIGGTMFWVRASIYKKIFTGIDIDEIINELPPSDKGGKIHALERILGYIVYSENYKIQGI